MTPKTDDNSPRFLTLFNNCSSLRSPRQKMRQLSCSASRRTSSRCSGVFREHFFLENRIVIAKGLKVRETSNKALNAINQIPSLITFLMAFLENRDKIPSRTLAAAGMCHILLFSGAFLTMSSPAISYLLSNQRNACTS